MPPNVPTASGGSCQSEYFPNRPVWTPEIERNIALVVQWILCDLPGSHLWGIQRVGKSEFVEYFLRALPAVLGGNASIVVWSFLGFKPKDKEEMLRKCLIDTGNLAIASRDINVLRLRLVTAILDKCAAEKTDRVVLVADELQNISPSLFGVFMGITADLQKKGMRPHFLSIGQPEMCQTVATLLDNRELQTIGRLFPTSSEYRGLSLNDVKELLKNMDGEGREFTAKHFPNRYAEGWGLVDLFLVINQAVEQIFTKKNLTAKPLLPLGYLRPALNRIFYFLSEKPSEVVDRKYALDSFLFSGFHKVAEYYVEKPQD